MPDSLFTDKDGINKLDTSSNPIHQSIEHNEQEEEEEEEKQEEQVNVWSGLTLTENDSFLAILKRLCIYWRRILLNNIRLMFTLLFMSMLNITARITCFVRQWRPSTLSSSPPAFSTTVASSSIRTLEENLNDSSKSLLFLDKTHKQQIDLPSLQNSKMAHILVQQQTHRSSNISIHPTTSSQKDSKLPMTHSVDDRLFLKDSTCLLHLLTRFASEPQISKYPTQSTNTNGHFSKSSPVVLALSPPPVSNQCLQVDQSDKDEIHFDDIFYLNCDKIQPVSTSLTEDFNSDKTDNITTITDPLSEQIATINADDVKSQQLNEDILFDTSPSINNNDIPCERHFRRRKRRSSLTKTSTTNDDTQSITDLLEKIDINHEQSQKVNENLELKPDDNKQDTNIIETKTSENQESNKTVVDDEKPASLSRYRGRRLRHRFYRHAASASASSSTEAPSNTSPQFYLPNEALDIEPPRLHSPPPSSPVTLSPLPSPVSPPLPIVSKSPSPRTTTITGGLKRVNSVGITKKNVRFADTVGRELAQVQYIHSSTNDESKELSFLLGSSLLSSSPPSYTKNNLYVPNTLRLEHKPWSFDVALAPNKQFNESPLPRRFFCLYRQPNSEHPDIYLHEIWKSQIKLEHADIPIKCSSTGEQQLIGTLWVTNANYWKYVSVKYTFNRWLNTYEHEAQHRRHSNDFRNLDQFEFTINIPADVDRIDFILRYCVNGQEYWDNNEGKNYTLQTESAYTPSTTISLPHDCDFNEMRFY